MARVPPHRVDEPSFLFLPLSLSLSVVSSSSFFPAISLRRIVLVMKRTNLSQPARVGFWKSDADIAPIKFSRKILEGKEDEVRQQERISRIEKTWMDLSFGFSLLLLVPVYPLLILWVGVFLEPRRYWCWSDTFFYGRTLPTYSNIGSIKVRQ